MNLDALVLSPTEDGLKIRRVDNGENVAHVFRGVDRIEALKVVGGPNLVNIKLQSTTKIHGWLSH